MNRKASGFTIIELIVVIALLGILSAVALPRFISVTDDAHTAAVSGAGAGFATGVALIRAQAIANNITSGAVDGFGTGDLQVNASGAPTSVGGTSPFNTNNCEDIWTELLQSNAPSVSGADPDYTIESNNANPCVYTYRTANEDGNNRVITYDHDDRSVVVNADGES